MLHHATPKDLDVCVDKMKNTLSSIKSWAADNNLLLNETWLFPASRCLKCVILTDTLHLSPWKIRQSDRVKKFKLLGTWLSENFKRTKHVDEVTSSCYKMLATLRKVKNMTSQETKKSLVQSLVLSKLNFNDSVIYPLPTFPQERVQRVQNAAAGFILNRFCPERDDLELGWPPTLEYPIKHS